MTAAKQELMDPRMVNAVREYEASMGRWTNQRAAEKRGTALCTCLAAPLWLISFWASGQAGPVNQATWFMFFTISSFVAASGLSIASVVLAISNATQTKPVQPVLYEKIERAA